MPEGSTRHRLSEILQELSRRYRGPEFPPHVTLVGSIRGDRDELIEKSRRVSAVLEPMTLRLGNIGMMREYFRDLFIHAGPLDLLRKSHVAASKILVCPADPDFMPHLSLLYGSHSQSLKEKITDEIGAKLPGQFKVRNLRLYATEGEVATWHEVTKFSIT